MRVNYSEPYKIVAEWHPKAEPMFLGPWTRKTLVSAEGFINHNIQSRHNRTHGLVRLKLYEMQYDGSEKLILSMNTTTGLEALNG